MALDTEHPGMFDFEPGDPKPSCPGVVQGEALVTSRESTAPGSAALCIAPDLKHPIELSRRALPVLEAEADECAICLEVFTADDPSAKTQCGHEYHLQCIMQWAQRSRECPMCFQALHLQDEGLNELLPFGEYVPPPQQAGPSHVLMGMDQYELDRLLASLALHSGGRRSRGQRQSLRAAARAAAAADSGAAGPDALDAHMEATASARERRAGATAAVATGAPARGSSAAEGGRGGDFLSSYFGSWPPAGSHDRDYEVHSPSTPRARGHTSADLKSRFAALGSRAKETLSKTSKEFKTLFAQAAGSENAGPSGASQSSRLSTTPEHGAGSPIG